MKNPNFSPESQGIEHPWIIIERLRQRQGVTKKTLAERLQINYSYLVDLLNGRYQSKIDSKKVQIISDILHIPLDELLNRLHQPAEPISEPSPKPIEPITETIPPQIPTVTESKPPAFPPLQTFRVPLIKYHSDEKVPDFNGFVKYMQGEEKHFESADGNYQTPPYASAGETGQPIVAIKLEDDSMFPPFPAGSTFLVNLKKVAHINELVLVVIKDGRMWLREWREVKESNLVLKSYNSNYEYLQIALTDVLTISPVISVEING